MKRMSIVSMVVFGVAALACGGSGSGGGTYSGGLSSDLTNPELREFVRSNYGDNMQVSAVLSQLDMDPANDETWGDLGDALEPIDVDAAAHCYVHALNIDPGDSEWNRKVVQYRGADEIGTIYQSILETPRANDEVWGDYGDFLNGQGNRDEACNAWRQAQSMDPDDSEWGEKVATCN